MIDPERESGIAMSMLVGGGFFVLGVILAALGFVAGGSLSILGLVAAAGGLAAMAFGVLAGYRRLKRDQEAPMTQAENCRVVARFGINHLGEMLFTIEEVDISDLTYYVRIQMPDGRQAEFKTVWPVFSAAGEGMWGRIAYQGDWLAGFTQTPAPPWAGEL